MELRRGSETVLVVDDEVMVMETARDMLERFGYRVITATGGREAIDLYSLRLREIDAVVLDMVMPDVDGREVLTRMLEVNPRAKVIVSSGQSRDEAVDAVVAKNAAAFIPKPYRMTDLIKTVGDVVTR